MLSLETQTCASAAQRLSYSSQSGFGSSFPLKIADQRCAVKVSFVQEKKE